MARYRAFMSYCHADQSWAAWLHRALEAYRVPKRLVGTTGLHGPIPKRLAPIFRDRDDLSSASDLSQTIKSALADSDSMLVICSPSAAKSSWVNEEIRHFRSLGKGDRIHCVIVDGDPTATGTEQACIPSALTDNHDGQLVEPLAADVRKWADGKSLAKLKLIAGVLGVRLDELRQRHQHRKWKLQAMGGFAVLVAVALLFLTVDSRIDERDAQLAREEQQALAENMLARFLEQAERLGDLADIETRKAFGEVMAGYLSGLDQSDLTYESRRQLGVVLMNRGVILYDEGQLDQAMEVFESSGQVLQSLVNDSQGDAEAMFELSQVEYWIGQVHFDLGRLREAGEAFRAYAKVSDALHALQPDNAGWTMEAAYAQSNLGNLERSRIPSDPQVALTHYQMAFELNEKAARQNPEYERELADSHADLADAWLGICELEKAMDQRLRNVELAASFHAANPASNRVKADYAHSLSGLHWVQLQAGQVDAAMDSIRQSLDLQAELVGEDPANLNKKWSLLKKSSAQAYLLELSGNTAASWEQSLSVETNMRKLMEQYQNNRIDYVVSFGMFLRDFAYRAYRKGETAMADRLLNESLQLLSEIAQAHPDSKKVHNDLALAYFYYWDNHGATLPDGPAASWLENNRGGAVISGCTDMNIAARQAVMDGAPEDGRGYVDRLTSMGYHEPVFERFCAKFGLCAD